MHHLQKVLAKKRDPVTHVCFMEELTKVKYFSAHIDEGHLFGGVGLWEILSAALTVHPHY